MFRIRIGIDSGSGSSFPDLGLAVTREFFAILMSFSNFNLFLLLKIIKIHFQRAMSKTYLHRYKLFESWGSWALLYILILQSSRSFIATGSRPDPENQINADPDLKHWLERWSQCGTADKNSFITLMLSSLPSWCFQLLSATIFKLNMLLRIRKWAPIQYMPYWCTLVIPIRR